MVDKMLVSNGAALKAKYADSGLRAIRAAIRELVAADKRRGDSRPNLSMFLTAR